MQPKVTKILLHTTFRQKKKFVFERGFIKMKMAKKVEEFKLNLIAKYSM